MTDYFHTNFYLSLGIGSDRHPYKITVPKLKGGKTDATPKFSHPEGKAHRAVRQALGKSRFAAYETRGHGNIIALGEDRYLSGGEAYFSPLYYSSCKTAQKRMDKLLAAGIRCRLSGSSGGFLVFSGYTEETECALEAERREAAEALNKWNIKQNSSQNESR
jgi:hypothetical protein